MNNNIGIILPNLEMSQLAFETINTINQEISTNNGYDYRIFFENLSARCLDVMCSTMNLSEVYSYDGLIISTTLDNTRTSLNAVGNLQRAFLVWDLEFIRNQNNFVENLKIYRDPRLKLITRSNDHDKVLMNYTNRKADLIMPKLSLERIKNEFTRSD